MWLALAITRAVQSLLFLCATENQYYVTDAAANKITGCLCGMFAGGKKWGLISTATVTSHTPYQAKRRGAKHLTIDTQA